MAKTSTKHKHLTLDERIEIQGCLDHGMTFKDTAKRVSKDQTTISKEVKKHLTIKEVTFKQTTEDGSPVETPPCPKLLKAPFVCNPCQKRRGNCQYRKQLYLADRAQKEYEALLVESREGIPLNKESFYAMDAIVSEGIRRGQHLYHISQSHELGVSKSTVYRHLHKGYLSVSKLDFPRVVKFKPRKMRRPDTVPKAAKIGRSYDDFRAYIDETQAESWVEMDTVIGRVGGKVILTLNFNFCNFMAAILLDDKTAAEVTCKITALKKTFAANHIRFGDIFPVLLTDNGGEFSNIAVFENALDGNRESRLFFCDPMQSSQKPRVEKNHTLFRDIVPKGASFDDFTQETVNLIFSHVNSVKRKCLHGKSPYEVFTFTSGTELASLLGIDGIPAEQVIQSPLLLKR